MRGFFKKELAMIFLFLMSLVSVSAIQFQGNQDVTIPDYEDSDISYITSIFTFGSDNFNYLFTPMGGNTTITWTYDIREYVDYLGGDMYIIYPNDILNNTIEIHLTTYPSSNDPITTTYTITMDEKGSYYFRVRPDFEGEKVRIEINAENGFANDIKFASIKNKYVENVNSITNTFIGAMKDFIDIQIGFWKILYYLFIFSLVIGGIGILVGFAFTIYDWAERTSDKRKKMFESASKTHNER